MKRKRKKKEEKKRKEAKRKRYCPDSNSGPSVHRATASPLGPYVNAFRRIYMLRMEAQQSRTIRYKLVCEHRRPRRSMCH